MSTPKSEHNPDAKRFYSPKEIAEITGLAYSTVRLHIDKGIIPMVRVGSRKLVPISYLDGLETQARKDARARSRVNARAS